MQTSFPRNLKTLVKTVVAANNAANASTAPGPLLLIPWPTTQL
jgi:hypothetical protein